jgi:hypothetical protein
MTKNDAPKTKTWHRGPHHVVNWHRAQHHQSVHLRQSQFLLEQDDPLFLVSLVEPVSGVEAPAMANKISGDVILKAQSYTRRRSRGKLTGNTRSVPERQTNNCFGNIPHSA